MSSIKQISISLMAFVVTGSLAIAQDAPLQENYEKALSEKYKGKSYSPYAKRDFASRPLWGDSHVHTGISFDAGAGGCILLLQMPPGGHLLEGHLK